MLIETRNVDGSNAALTHAVGSIVEFIPDVTWGDRIYDALSNVVDISDLSLDTTKVVDLTTAQTLTNKTISGGLISGATLTGIKISNSDITLGTINSSGATISAILDEDDMASDSALALPTQQSVKAYVDTKKTLTSTDDHIVLTPGTSKLVKVAVLRQDDTTNSYVNNSIVLTGWGWIIGTGVASVLSETVTFGITFSSAPIVLSSSLGGKTGSTPAAITELTGQNASLSTPRSITTTNFVEEFWERESNNYNATIRYGYSWIAIGQLN